MTGTKEILSDDVRHQVEELAGVKRLERFAEKAGKHARALGIKEEDVPRLVDEVRRENRTRGR